MRRITFFYKQIRLLRLSHIQSCPKVLTTHRPAACQLLSNNIAATGLTTVNARQYHQHNGQNHRNYDSWGSTVGIVTGILALCCYNCLNTSAVKAAEREDERKAKLLLGSCQRSDLEAVRKLIKDGV